MDIERSGAIALIDAYFAGWNADDAGAVARLFAPGGTYVDPTIAGCRACDARLPERPAYW